MSDDSTQYVVCLNGIHMDEAFLNPPVQCHDEEDVQLPEMVPETQD